MAPSNSLPFLSLLHSKCYPNVMISFHLPTPIIFLPLLIPQFLLSSLPFPSLPSKSFYSNKPLETTLMGVETRISISSSSILFIQFLISYLIPFSTSLPSIVLHGISDSCTGTDVVHFTQLLEDKSGAHGYCIEIGNGSWDSLFTPLMKQTKIACEKLVKSIEELKDGYNIVALSQGNLVARGLIQFCDEAPPVKNYISLAGPHAGIASVPYCGVKVLCLLGDYVMELLMYTPFVQEHFAPSNYMKIPIDIKGYLKGYKYLPMLNNEISSTRNSTYKKRFASLENLVLVMFEEEVILVSKERPLGLATIATDHLIQSSILRRLDWIGLKTLDEAGKVKFVTAPGAHLKMSDTLVENYILPYIKDKDSLHEVVTRSSSYTTL